MILAATPSKPKCKCPECRKKVGILVGTYFEGASIKLKRAVFFIYAWAHDMSSIKLSSQS